MKAFDIDIDEGSVCILAGGMSKEEALDQLVDAMSHNPAVLDKERFRDAVFERESVMSTGIGDGIAIPHVRLDEIGTPILGLAVSREGVDFDTLDAGLVHIMILFAMPSSSQNQYLDLLAQVMLAIRAEGFKERLMACTSPAAVLEVLDSFDA